MKNLNSIIFISFLMLGSPLFSWEMGGEPATYVCFRPSSQSPVKVTIEKWGDINITWKHYPVEYKFISWGNNSLGSPQLVSGGIWLSEFNDDNSIEDFVNGNPFPTDWIDPAIVVFYPKERKLSYGIVGKFSYQMECVVL